MKSRDGKSQREEKKREDQRRERVRRKKMPSVFPMICGSGESKSRLAKAVGSGPDER